MPKPQTKNTQTAGRYFDLQYTFEYKLSMANQNDSYCSLTSSDINKCFIFFIFLKLMSTLLEYKTKLPELDLCLPITFY